MPPFEDFVNTELPLRVSIATSPSADTFPRFNGIGKATTARTSAQLLTDIRAASADFLNGSFKESFDALIINNLGTIECTLEQSGGGNLTMQFSDGETVLDCTPAAVITPLQAGTATIPQQNFIYVTQASKVPTSSTTGWPAEEHIKIAYCLVQTAALVGSDGALVNQNWNDHLMGTDDQGHMTHIAERLRREGAKYFSGINETVNITPGSPDTVDLALSSGVVYQMHRQTFAAFDTATGDKIYVPNDSVTPYTTVTDLADLLTDNTGASMSGNYFNLVIWAVQNKGGELSPVMCNLPSGSYKSLNDAINDVSGYDDFSIPGAFQTESSTGFLLYRFTFKHSVSGGGDWTLENTTDLRGLQPTAAAGSTSNQATIFSDGQFAIFDNADQTKQMVFEVSAISPATTRTITYPDRNIDLSSGGTFAENSHTHAASDITSGTLAHERGGLEADVSAIAKGDVLAGTATGTIGIISASGASDGDVPTIQADGSLAFEPQTGGAGEANTGSDLGGTAGTFKQKVGVDLEFRGVSATSSKIAVVENATDIGIDVNEANLTIAPSQLSADGAATNNVLAWRGSAWVPVQRNVSTGLNLDYDGSGNFTWSIAENATVPPISTAATGIKVPIKTTSGDPTPTSNNGRIYYNDADNKFRACENGAWADVVGAGGGGETNTGSNVNVAGVGVFDGKVGVDLQFRGVKSEDSTITVTLDAANNEIDLAIVDSTIVLAASQVTSGTFADARISESSVTQHQAALTLAASQITSGTLDDARIPQNYLRNDGNDTGVGVLTLTGAALNGLILTTDNATFNSQFSMKRGSGAASGVLSGADLGSINFDADYDGGPTYTTTAQITAEASENHDASNKGTRIFIQTTADGETSKKNTLVLQAGDGGSLSYVEITHDSTSDFPILKSSGTNANMEIHAQGTGKVAIGDANGDIELGETGMVASKDVFPLTTAMYNLGKVGNIFDKVRANDLYADAGVHLKVTSSNVANPPTDAQLDALYGAPGSGVDIGFTAVVDDSDSANTYLVCATATNEWRYVALTVA